MQGVLFVNYSVGVNVGGERKDLKSFFIIYNKSAVIFYYKNGTPNINYNWQTNLIDVL